MPLYLGSNLIGDVVANPDRGVDTSGDTVAADKMLAGITAHDSEGEPITGTIGNATLATPAVNSSGLVTASVSAGNIASTTSKTLQLATQAAKTITPSTSVQTAVAAGKYTTGNITVAAANASAQIVVTAPTGSTVTATKGSTTLTATEQSGTWTFALPEFGTWTVTASKGTESTSDTITVEQDSEVELAYAKVYGISRDVTASSPAWARTDNAIGKTATASVGTTAGASSFNSCYPWSGIVRETLSTGDVMVKIPKFWYRRYKEGNIEYIKIADSAVDGFALHPAFNHGGVPKDYLYVGAYKTSSNNRSVSGATPQVSQTRATFRTNARAKGAGWGLIDISALSAIQMLILVEFATNNVQAAIGRGYCDGNTAALTVGSCNSVPNLTGRPSGTDGKTDVVWRGIEGMWGNVWEWVDGVNWNGGTYYVCNDPTKYADSTSTNYTALSFTGSTSWSGSYITTEGLDTGNNPHVMLPSAAGSGSETTYQCDGCGSSTGWRVFLHGGVWNDGSIDGLFTAALSFDSSYSRTHFGSRILCIPQ